MARRAIRGWRPVLFAVLALPLASAATMGVTSGTLGAGAGTPAACASAPIVGQNVEKPLLGAPRVVSVDVVGIAAACGGGTVRVTVYNNSDTAEEATKAIPAGGGSVNLALPSPVTLTDSHFVAVTLQGP